MRLVGLTRDPERKGDDGKEEKNFLPHRARRGAEDRGLVSEIAYTQLVAVQTGAEVGAAA